MRIVVSYRTRYTRGKQRQGGQTNDWLGFTTVAIVRATDVPQNITAAEYSPSYWNI